MKKNRASRTAEYMALFRAMETVQQEKKRLFSDPYAKFFLSPGLQIVAALAKIPLLHRLQCHYIDAHWPGARTAALGRTRFIDEEVLLSLEAGALSQLVFLGAGFDTRAWRLPVPDQIRTFEVDHPSTSARKQEMLAPVLSTRNSRVHFVAVDFNNESLDPAMIAAGFDRSSRSLIIWEGVTNYLSENAVNQTLRWCASLRPGSRIIFTYIHEEVLRSPEKYYGAQKVASLLQSTEERWTFGIDPASLESYLSRLGLKLESDVGAREYRRRFFGNSSEQMRGYEFYRIAVASVPSAGQPLNQRME